MKGHNQNMPTPNRIMSEMYINSVNCVILVVALTLIILIYVVFIGLYCLMSKYTCTSTLWVSINSYLYLNTYSWINIRIWIIDFSIDFVDLTLIILIYVVFIGLYCLMSKYSYINFMSFRDCQYRLSNI